MKTSIRCVLLMLCLFSGRAEAQDADAHADKLEAAARVFVPDLMKRFEVAGVSIAVVDPSGVRGIAFGVSDPATGAAIDPWRTRFHAASVTKLLTSIAVLQLADQGLLRLDDPIATHLPPDVARPLMDSGIQIRHVLTHTAGFADQWVGMAATAPEDVWSIRDYVRRRPAVIVEPPGTVTRYSNYGFTLVGLVVEHVTGLPFQQVVRRRVLEPLGMTGSYIGPRPIDEFDAPGLFYRSTITREPAIYEHTVPAGGLHGPVTDLARVAAIVTGIPLPGSAAVVSPEGIAAIRPPSQGVAGWGLGVFRYGDVADAWITAGEVPGFSTRILMLPRRRAAIVVAVNRKDPSLATALFDRLVEQEPRVAAVPPDDSTTSQLAASGRFRATLTDPSSFLKFGSLFAPVVVLESESNGGVTARFENIDRKTLTLQWRAGGVLVDPTGIPVARAIVDREGKVHQLDLGDRMAGALSLLPVAWHGEATPTLAVTFVSALSALIALGVLIVGPVRRRARASGLFGPVLVTAGVTLLYLLGFVVGIAQLMVRYDDRFAFGLPWWFVVVLWLPMGLAAALVWLAYRATVFGVGSRLGTLAAAWLVATTTALLAVVWQWRMYW